MPDSTDEYLQLLADCENRESRLTEWERGFVDSLRDRIESGRAPTPDQVKKLDEVWERVTARG